MTHAPDLPLAWRAPSARTGLGIALVVLGGSGVATFAVVGLLVDHVPRTADVPVQGALGSLAVLALGFGLFFSVPRMRIDLARREVRRGPRVVAELSRCRAVLLRRVEQRMVGQAGGAMTASWWIAAVVLDAGGSVDGPVATADLLRAADVVELVRAVPRPQVESFARALAAALDRPIVTVNADADADADDRATL